MADPNAAAPELKRIRWLVRVAFLWAVIIFGRLAWLQTYWHEQLLQKADKQQEADFEIQPPRGAIVTRDGAYLAVSVPAWTVIVNPRKLAREQEPEAMRVLVQTLHLDAGKLKTDLANARKRNRAFLKVKVKADNSEYQALRNWMDAQNKRTPSLQDDIEWLAFQQESWRAYPNGDLAAPLIGSVDFSERGNSGVEQTLQKDLQGKPGWVRMLKDSQSHYVNALERQEPTPGKQVTLTIDSHLQFFCDRELAKAVHEKGFASGSIVVMNPNNGEVYAMSSYPGFDRSKPVKNMADLSQRVHRAIGHAPDGGSVMKMMTIASALEHTNLRATSLIDCGNGEFRYSKRDSIGDTHAYGVMPMEKVLWMSSNVGAIRIGIEVGRQNLFQTLRDFGFGQRTGIALPGESAGLLHPVEKWHSSSIYYVSMGHEIGVTTMQLAQAAAVFANGGYRVKPKLVLSKATYANEIEWEPESPKTRVLKGATAVEMRRMSEGVVLFGTGQKAKILGRTVGGKTGTAQLVDTKTGRYVKLYASSFMGYAPLAAPKVVVVVTLHGGKVFGGTAAAPVFSLVAAEALNMLGEPPDVPMPEELPKLASGSAAKAAQTAKAATVEEPAPAQVASNEVVTGSAVPDFMGLDKRTVAKISAERGVPVEMTGVGLARAQTPAAGSLLGMGATVHVRFAR